ncbi:peptidoglycan DD-metalloendopeptidase family protein [Tepidiforma bonchosmolovskayae]|jgi:murein DD-endopeptidase MepM/ murein hydrolase activator NlpD|uniref:Peptidoglycan DD-metalloendopeptidase family protein n=1 Tax=Tepidiforma bonchosmolovskayae TaxID=2601677 RepID=A0ABX6C071_9CHLR|nr:peptidoglycan DD-metalloendopeptidase family protein [Tepidiforma bonchosmolovskayae]
MGIEGTRARSHAHARRHGRLTVHVLIVALALVAVVSATRFPARSSASAQAPVPQFAFSGVAGAAQRPGQAVFRPAATTQTLGSVVAVASRTEALDARAVGGVSPVHSLSAGVTAAAATSGEVGAGIKPLADIIDPRSPIVEYETQAGDTVSGVAAKFGISMQTLLDNNPTVRNPNLLPKGLILIIPRKDGILHKVAYGETVDSIVKQYDNITAAQVIEYKPNNITDPNNLEAGKMLLLVGAKIKPPPPPPPPPQRPSQPGVPSGPSAGGAPAPSSGGIFKNFPLAAWRGISDPFGTPRGGSSYHTGIDLDLYGFGPSPLFAVCDGVVSRTEYLTYSYGYYVVIDCGGGWTTLYAHMSQIDVVPGQAVSAGQTIGLTGLTGFTTGHHLHFEIRYNGGFVDPALYLNF